MEYILNKNAQIGTGYHKIHKRNCPKAPKEVNTIILGKCLCPIEARIRANEYYNAVSGCRYCCNEIFYQK